MVITVTLNPALDKTIYVPDFKAGTLNRVKKVREDPGGKGINISKVISKLKGETLALGFLGGKTGEYIANSLNELNIDHDFTWVKGQTRTNIKIIDLVNGRETELNEPGVKIEQANLEKLEERLVKKAAVDDYIILAGSLPPEVPNTIYADLIAKLQKRGSKVALDTSGRSLKEGLKAKPHLIKPNLYELEMLVNKDLDTKEEIVAAGKNIYDQGIEIVVISLGAKGSIVISEKGIWQVTPPSVEVESTIGAGDTLLGALTLKLSQGQNLQQAIVYATAASANSVTKPGTQLCCREEVEKLLSEVSVKEL